MKLLVDKFAKRGCAVFRITILWLHQAGKKRYIMAGELGFEPRRNDPESFVLPLHYSPVADKTNIRMTIPLAHTLSS